MRCATYCTSENYAIRDFFNHFQAEAKQVEIHDGVLQLKLKEKIAFFFPYGCVSFWNFDEALEHETLHQIKSFESGEKHHPHHDKIEYAYSDDTAFDEENDCVSLGSDDPLLKLSLSHGFTQSVKLAHFEVVVDEAVENLGNHPNQLAKQGKISLSRKKLSQKIGQLFAVRHNINLHSDVLDTPEYFWRRPRFEAFYKMSTEFLDLPARIGILNQRLDVLREFYEILSNELNHHHSMRVEIIITLLIAVEVVLAVMFKF